MQVMTGNDFLDPDTIREGLNTKVMGKKAYCFWETGSTQTVAQGLAKSGAEEGTIVLAEGQTEGKGRMGRSWFSPLGKGIWVSIILRPLLPPSLAGRVSLISALAVAEAIREVTGLPALIKWPNDLVISEKKVGGILTEMSAEMEQIKFIILGIGINVNQDEFLEELKGKALSLHQGGGKEVSRLSLLRNILRRLDNYYPYLQKGELGTITNRWRELSATLGKQVRVSFQGEVIEGQAVDIDSEGALLLRLDSGFVKCLTGGEVSMIH